MGFWEVGVAALILLVPDFGLAVCPLSPLVETSLGTLVGEEAGGLALSGLANAPVDTPGVTGVGKPDVKTSGVDTPGVDTSGVVMLSTIFDCSVACSCIGSTFGEVTSRSKKATLKGSASNATVFGISVETAKA